MNVADFLSFEKLGIVAIMAIAVWAVWREWMKDRAALIATHERFQELIVVNAKGQEGVKALLQTLLDEVRRNSR